MKILTTVAEVATVEEDFEIDGTAIDERYLEYDLNEWDDYAIEEAVRLTEEGLADEVVTVTIGPERVEETIRMALAKGADRAIRVWDSSLEELLDVAAKTEILRAVVAEEKPDLILTGVQTGDAMFGATGVSLAAAVDYSWAAVVNDLEFDGETTSVHRELEGGVEELTDVETPAVLTIQTGINEPRYASLRGIRQAQSKEIAVEDLADLALDGLDSKLRLTEMYEPEVESDATVFEGSAEDTAVQLAGVLREKGVGAQ
ncbi:electron transfer flavoprotein subunit beta/FixA family protein [Halalkalicoccus jeotgali]|uniref:Electron transfer flavoprotein alpha/beta-subunit n=1 Tax=Halalkalicoccus jeotgali (strain DSM 18796 / CECT 7217 / JCM 14584 / KCTC 4019 / B3) TaxID=795797 RepID=D8JCU5_HALJB|nr:electron transfer flavoprotein subunit beta/FixA family protein [Halalkalicoccus jeotgali]ADJ16840.1 Electron transfer flavoprotein alpha/beta-subunit [Halalkalicoccus jeotgali B3]ELY38724.1 Electron transfer flavoprotein alpha/beta-subunit [Halalkalicoccus jeotgali B3]